MKYTETHEWIDVQGTIATIGITHFAQKELGDIVYVELPKIGKEVKAGEEVVVLESTKAAADVYSPISGTIVEINERLKEDAGLVNRSSEKEGWLYKIEIKDASELEKLLDASLYEVMTK